jgi:hypothetical protein
VWGVGLHYIFNANPALAAIVFRVDAPLAYVWDLGNDVDALKAFAIFQANRAGIVEDVAVAAWLD